ANHEIAWVTVALQHLSVGEPFLGPDRSCAPVVADPTVRRVQPGHVAAPASLLALANCRQPQVTARHATLCPGIEGRPEDRAAKPGDTRPVPGEPSLTGVWPRLGLARMPGRVSSLAG